MPRKKDKTYYLQVDTYILDNGEVEAVVKLAKQIVKHLNKKPKKKKK